MRGACCVPGCKDKSARRVCIPMKPQVRRIWVLRIDNPRLSSADQTEDLSTFRICWNHFHEMCFGPNKRLLPGSLPTLKLPNWHGPSTRENCFNHDPDGPVLGFLACSQPTADANTGFEANLPTKKPTKVYSAKRRSNLSSKGFDGLDSKCNLLEQLKDSDDRMQSFRKTTGLFPSNPETIVGDRDTLSLSKEDNFPLIVLQSSNDYDGGNHSPKNICRVCLRADVNEEMVKLYVDDEAGESIRIKDMMKFVLPDLECIFPNSAICRSCLTLLTYSNELKKISQSSEQELGKLIEERKNITDKNGNLIYFVSNTVKTEDLKDSYVTQAIDLCTKETAEVDLEKQVKDDVPNDVSVSRTVENNLTNYSINIPSQSLWGDSKVDDAFVTIPPRRFVNIMGPGPYLCDECGEIVQDRVRFHRHYQKHNPIKVTKPPKLETYVCDKCGAIYKNSRQFLKHTKFGHLESKYACDLCPRVFKYEKSLVLHKKQRHMKLKDDCQCHICGKKFTYKSSLRLHLLTHNAYMDRPYDCSICGARFSLLCKLKRHMIRHEEAKLECNYCGKMFKYLITLNNHIKSYHLKQGKFICHLCNRVFTKKGNLTYHCMRIHGCIEEQNVD